MNPTADTMPVEPAGRALAPVSARGAWEAGLRLAADPQITQPASTADEGVVSALHRCSALMVGWGVRVEIVRTRVGCAVVRVTSNSEEGYLFAKSAFGAIPANLGLGSGVVVEANHEGGVGAGRLYTVLWTSPELSRAPDTEAVVAVPVMPQPDSIAVAPSDSGPPLAAPVGSPESPVRPAPPFLETLAAHGSGGAAPVESAESPVRPAPPFLETLAAHDSGGPGTGARPAPAGPEPPDRPQSPPVTDLRPPTAPRPVDPGSQALPAPPNSWVSSAQPVSSNDPPTGERLRPTVETAQRPKLPLFERPRRPAWLWRRAWILVITILAGVFGAQMISLGHPATYTARATLVVQSGAGAKGPGAANDAAALAITYAAFIPTDAALIEKTAKALNLSEAQVAANISVSAESGTSVLVLSYSASTAAQAVKAAVALSQAIAQSPPGSGIPSGSINVVRQPNTASPTSSLRRYALPIGGLLGLAIGLIIVLGIERSDPRLDDSRTVSEVFGCPSNAIPEEIGLPELARAVALVVDNSKGLTVLPLERSDRASAENLVARLLQVWPLDLPRPLMSVLPEFDSAAIGLSQGSGPTLIVLAAGVSRRKADSVAERLRLINRDPLWAVVTGRIRPAGNAG